MSNSNKWSRNIELRIVMLRDEIEDFSIERLSAKAGWSVQRHRQVTRSSSLQMPTMARMATALGTNVSVLLDEDPVRIVSEPIPSPFFDTTE